MNRFKNILTSLSVLLSISGVYGKTMLSDSTQTKADLLMAIQTMQLPQKMVEMLTQDVLHELPVYLSRSVNNNEYKVAITNARLYETYAELTAYAMVPVPQGPNLFFGISGLKFSYEGGFIGTARLCLLGDISIPFNGGNASLVLKGSFDIQSGRVLDEFTYMEIDCSGFKELGLSAEVVFPRSMLIPCDANGEALASGNVRGRFSTVIKDWNDILADISFPSFQLNGLKEVVFSIQKAVFDFSDLRNSADVRFPENYQERYLMVPDTRMWRGVSINSLSVMLPKAFSNGGPRVSFEAADMLIDNNGISGTFIGNNILSFEKGNASGWHFSVNRFQLGLEANTITGAGFEGNIALPIAPKDTLHYTAIIAADNKYLMKVEQSDTMRVDLWNASMRIDPHSWVKLEMDNDRFLPEAMLHGRIDIDAKMGSKSIGKFEGITFRGLHLQAKAPYLAVEYLGYEGDISIANFPASIDHIAFQTNGNTTSLSFGLNLTLMENAFKGATRIHVLGKMEEQDGFMHWSYDGCKLERINIDNAKMGGFSLNGAVEFLNDDPVYGDGFGGAITMEIEALDNLKVNVRARFGKTDFRYWFVDGLAEFSPGLPVGTFLTIDGLSGGAYYRMSKMKNRASSTGMPEYKPDKTYGLGVKFGMMFTATNKPATILDGQVEFEMAFNHNGGLNYIGLFGNGVFLGKLPGPDGKSSDKALALYNRVQDNNEAMLEGLSDDAKRDKLENTEKLRIDKPTEAAKSVDTGFNIEDGGFSGLAAYFGIHYDFQARAFHASFEVYINAALGLIQGVGQNYRAGWSEIHAEPGNWHILMGTPTDPIGIQFGLGNFRLRTEAYFMAGTDIPGSPPPPQEVADILRLDQSELDYMRELNNLGEGKGIAFGSHLKLETGDITFLILYANFKAGLGFDLMMKKYDAYCEGSNELVGINGWYANAQAYGFFQGELGVKVNLWFLKARFPIIKGAAAALMQAKLPNPSWFRGYLGVEFSVLGGLVSGNMRFKLEFGQECKLVNADGMTNPVGIAVISDISPEEGNSADVFAAPQAAFNFPVGKEIPLSDDQGDKIYRVDMEQFTLIANGTPIEGSLKWNHKMDAVNFYSKEILPPNTTINVQVKVSFKEKKGATWQTVYIDGKKAEENKSVTFTTGAAPEVVPMHNIAYSWPTVEQHNFYPGESNRGYIQLKRGQKYLFDAQGVSQELLLAKAGGARQFISFTYNEADCRIEFALPEVPLSSDYAIAVVNKASGATMQENRSTTHESTSEDGTFVTQNRQAMSYSREDIAKTILEYPFHSSAFSSFADKVNSAQTVKTVWIPYSSSVISMLQQVSQLEPFDLNELTGTDYTDHKPLVQPVAVLDDPYFQSAIHPLIYARYPVDGIRFDRDTSLLGTVPRKALPIITNYQSAIEQGNFQQPSVTGQLPYLYDLPKVYMQDYHDLKTKVINRYLGTDRQKDFSWLIESYFPFIPYGHYKVRYQFVLPDGQKGSNAVVEYFNPIL